MSKILQITIGVVLAVVALAFCLLVRETILLERSVGASAHVALWNISVAAYDLHPALDAISGPRGTLHEANKAIVAVKDAVIDTQIQERAIAPHTIAAVDALATIAPHVNSLAQDGSQTLRTANSSIAAFQPLLGSLTRASDASTLTIQHFDSLIQSPDLAAALANVSATTQNMAGVTLDLRKVSDHETEEFLKPVRWYMVPIKRGGQMIDIAAAIARNAP